ncbi:PAS domain S-box protein [Halobellus sp. Atlit-31R]|nr:PAS domain S-box protein [Halobellus sp. Atlit-31R]
MTVGSRTRIVLVCGDDSLASSLRAVVEDRSRPLRIVAVGSPADCERARRDQPVDCVISRSIPDGDAPGRARADSPTGATNPRNHTATVPAIVYPSTHDPELARASTEEPMTRYLPASTDTAGHHLLLDAIDDFVARRARKQRRAAEHELLEQTARLADVGGWELDADRETLTWTDETYRLHGVSRSFDPTLENAIEFYHPDDRDAVRADIRAALSGEPFDSTYRLFRADGETRWVRSKGEPIFDDGTVVGVRGSFQDVSQRKSREEVIRRFKRAVEAAGHAIFITERDGTITYVNPAFEDVTGYAPAEVIGETPSMLKSGEMDEAYYRNLWTTVLSGDVWSEPIINERKSGEHYHASETIAPIVGDDGSVGGFVAIQTDITELIHTKERLETFREIVLRLEDPIMLQGCDGAFEVANDAIAEYAGIAKSDLIGLDEFAFMDEPTARRIREMKDRVIDEERAITYELSPTFPTKGERSFVTTRYPHYAEDGDIDGTVAICRDVTDQAEREHQLRVLDRILRHNLYNKMNLILGHAELLEGRTTGQEKRSVQTIRETGNELVDLADKERQIVDLLTDESESRRLGIRPLLEEVVPDLRAEYPDYSITIDCPEEYAVRAIPELHDAIAELLENAIVHGGDDPEVSVNVRRDGDQVVVTVTDTGPGIPEMEQQAAQGRTDITPLFHGSGLGLQFVYHVAKRSGGSLRFQSAEADGSGDDEVTAQAAGAVVTLYLPTPETDPDAQA